MWRHSADFFVLIGTTVLFIPFFVFGSAIDPVLMPRFLAWSVALFVLLGLVLARQHRHVEDHYGVLKCGIFPGLAACVVCASLSLLKAVNATEGIYEVLRLFLCLVYMSIAVTLLIRKKDHISTLARRWP